MEVLANPWLDTTSIASSQAREAPFSSTSRLPSTSRRTSTSFSPLRNLSPFSLSRTEQLQSSPLESIYRLRHPWKTARAVAVAGLEPIIAEPSAVKLLRPTPAEAARTAMEVCMEGTLSTLSEKGWPLGTEVRFAVDTLGNPVFRLQPGALHTQNLSKDSRCSLHVQLQQPGRQKPQCTLRGRITQVEDIKLKERLELAWERRFGKERIIEDALYVMNVEQALQSQDMGEEEIWVSGTDYSVAVADPLRECAPRIVEDMNRNHWEDVRRFCNVFVRLDAELEEASMTWVDRLGFDMRVLTKSPQNILEIRIPFSREVTDERDARSSLTIMAQIAWEQERNIVPTETLLATVEV